MRGRSRAWVQLDGTTNALGTAYAEVFQPLYGPDSAAQVRAHAGALGLFLHDLDLRTSRRWICGHRPARRPPDLGPDAGRDVRVTLSPVGSGGAKLAAGLYDVLSPGELTIVGNVGDDLEVLGLSVSAQPRFAPLRPRRPQRHRAWGGGQARRGRRSRSTRHWGGHAVPRSADLDIGLHLVRTAGGRLRHNGIAQFLPRASTCGAACHRRRGAAAAS